MAEEKNRAPWGIDEASEHTIDLARGAMESYLDYFQKTMFASPWAQTDLNKKIQSYAGKNLATTFEFAQKLTKAKDLQELVQIQTEFMQTHVSARAAREAYTRLAVPAVLASGGRYLARGDPAKTYETCRRIPDRSRRECATGP